jgi:hypothetical protein
MTRLWHRMQQHQPVSAVFDSGVWKHLSLLQARMQLSNLGVLALRQV